MSYSASDIRAVRLLIPDAEAIYGAGEDEYMFADEDIEIYLRLGKGSPMWAAGLASLAVGASEALVLKVTRNYETETDGSKLMAQWTAKGKLMIEQAKLEYDEAQDVGIFEIAFPEWDGTRHPEGQTHGSYRGLAPTGWQW